MTPSQETKLTNQLEEATKATKQLIATLQTEQKALSEHDVALLEATVSEKQVCLSGLKLLESSLGDTFKALGFDTRNGVLGQLEQLVHENIQLKTSVDFMRKGLEECSRLTEENAMLVSTGINNVRSSLDLIRGLYEEDVASVYGPPGQMSSNQFKRDIAKV